MDEFLFVQITRARNIARHACGLVSKSFTEVTNRTRTDSSATPHYVSSRKVTACESCLKSRPILPHNTIVDWHSLHFLNCIHETFTYRFPRRPSSPARKTPGWRPGMTRYIWRSRPSRTRPDRRPFPTRGTSFPGIRCSIYNLRKWKCSSNACDDEQVERLDKCYTAVLIDKTCLAWSLDAP